MIGIASDHAGFALKSALFSFLKDLKKSVVDYGPNSEAATSYPIYANKLCQALQQKDIDHGILICGSGIGMSIAANRFKGIRAALCLTPEMATLARSHNDANVLVLGARLMSLDCAKQILHYFLTTPFEEGRHRERLNMIEEQDHDY